MIDSGTAIRQFFKGIKKPIGYLNSDTLTKTKKLDFR